jgi:hypothetical protein
MIVLDRSGLHRRRLNRRVLNRGELSRRSLLDSRPPHYSGVRRRERRHASGTVPALDLHPCESYGVGSVYVLHPRPSQGG